MSGRDPGLQPERTALAWQRTGLSAGVAAVLLLRSGVSRGSPFGVIAAGFALVVVVLAGFIGRRPGNRGTPGRMLLATAAAGCAAGSFTVLELLN